MVYRRVDPDDEIEFGHQCCRVVVIICFARSAEMSDGKSCLGDFVCRVFVLQTDPVGIESLHKRSELLKSYRPSFGVVVS